MENSLHIYQKTYQRFSRVYQSLLQQYEDQLVHKDLLYLLEIGASVSTILLAVFKQAESEFDDQIFEGVDPIDFMRQDSQRAIFGTNEIEECIRTADEESLATFENSHSDKYKKLFTYRALKRLRSLSDRGLSLNNKFEKIFLPKYKDFQNKQIRDFIQKYNLTRKQILNLPNVAFDEILEIINIHTKKIPKDKIEAVQFLEQCISKYFPLVVDSFGYDDIISDLELLRSECKNKYTTICGRCGKSLKRIKKESFCNQTENRKCYLERRKENQTFEIPSVIAVTKNKCECCGKHSSLDNIHALNGVPRQFCSESCWNSFRKKEANLSKK